MGIFKKIKWQDYALALILILSFFLNFWVLAKEGYSNAYYSAAVKSMMQSPKAFFFASLDTGLYVTIDKPPLGLWLQTISAKVFGVNSFGLIFPSALAGCLCVLLVYAMVKKTWGATAWGHRGQHCRDDADPRRAEPHKQYGYDPPVLPALRRLFHTESGKKAKSPALSSCHGLCRVRV